MFFKRYVIQNITTGKYVRENLKLESVCIKDGLVRNKKEGMKLLKLLHANMEFISYKLIVIK